MIDGLLWTKDADCHKNFNKFDAAGPCVVSAALISGFLVVVAALAFVGGMVRTLCGVVNPARIRDEWLRASGSRSCG